MRKQWKRLISVLLVAVMIAMSAVTVFATEDSEAEDKISVSVSDGAEVKILTEREEITAGETVRFEVVLEEGYNLEKLEVLNSDDESEILVAIEDETIYSFVMPESKVSINVQSVIGIQLFAEIGSTVFNEGGNTLENTMSGISYDGVLEWLGQHRNDDYYLGTPYPENSNGSLIPGAKGGTDRRNPNGDCSGANGNDDYPGVAMMNCTGFVWHVLYKAAGMSYQEAWDGIPAWGGVGCGGWRDYLRGNGVEYKTYYASSWQDINSLIYNVIADGYTDPGDILWTWEGTVSSDGLPAVSSGNHHIGIYTGDYFNGNNTNEWWQSIGYSPYTGEFLNRNMYGLITPKAQCVAMTVIKLGRETPTGSVEIYKSSSNPELTDHNGAYSLAGAEYGVWLAGHGDEEPIAVLVTDENGYAKAEGLPPGEYWVKEITPPKGFALDTKSHYAPVQGNQTTTLHVTDKAQNDPVAILLGKIDAETTQNMPQGSASLAGAEFTVKYYSDFYNTDPAQAGAKPVRTWILKTDENGFAYLSPEWKVSGDDLYYNSAGRPTLPLGTITIQETKAPKGYMLNSEVFIRQIKGDGSALEGVETYNMPTIPETPQKGIIKIAKKSSEAEYGTATLKGAEYGVYKDKACKDKVDTLITDAKGAAQSKELPLGNYYVKETKNPVGFLIDPNVYPVDLTTDDKTERVFYKTVTSTEVPQKGVIKLQKADSETDKDQPQGAGSLKGALYDIFLKSAYQTGDDTDSKSYKGTMTTDQEGKAKSKELSLETYYVIERQPSTGYLVDPTIYEVTLSSENRTDAVFYKTVKSKENIIRGNVEIIKLKEIEDEDEDTFEGLGGVEFTFTSDTTGKAVKKIVTDKYGFATTVDKNDPRGGLVFDTYTVTETKCPEGLKPIEPFKVTIKDEGVTLKGIYKEDKLIVSPVSVVKIDESTGKVIPAADTEFRLLDENKKPITMTTHYPNKVEHETFKTDKNGQFTFPDKLKYGTYYLEEINAPEGYLKGKLLEFKVTEGATWEKPLIVKYTDENAMGQITVTKTSLDKKEKLAGAVFEIRAGEDIVTPDGTVRMKKGDLADTVTTGKAGTATSKKLFLGKYDVKEKQQPDGFVLNKKIYPVELKYKDQMTAVVTEELSVTNKPTEIEILKVDEETGKPLEGVTFKIWNKEMRPENETDKETGDNVQDDMGIFPEEDNVDIAGGAVSEYQTDADGKIILQHLVPGTYCIQETKTIPGYVLNDKIYEITISKDGRVENEEVGKIKVKNKITKLLGTTVKDQDTGTQESVPKKKVTFIDTVKFEDLQIGQEYIIKGKLMDKATGKPLLISGKEVTSEKKFKAEKSDGTVDVTFTFDASGLKGKQLVVFEKVYIGETEILSHEDLEDQHQTMQFPDSSIGTSAKDKATGTQEAVPGKKTIFIDTVKFENLIVGQEYTVKGILMDRSTEKPLLVNGKQVTTEKTFTPEKATGAVDVVFTFDASGLKGKQIVVFEKLYVDETEVAAHEDIKDKGQTIQFPDSKISTTAKDKATGTQEAIAKKNVTIIDTVKYENLIAGQEYTIKGVLMDKSTEKPLSVNEKTVTAEKTFTPETANGTVDMEFVLDASELKNKETVVFEKVFAGETEVAVHEDINDKGQTILFKIGKVTPNLPGNGDGGLLTALKTGDLAVLLPWIVLTILAAGSIAVVIVLRVRHKKENEEKKNEK